MAKQVQKNTLSNAEAASFCSQMGMILHAGISAIEGITIMKEDAASPQEAAILESIYDEFMKTGNFYEALKSSGVFPSYLLNMVRLGEQSGRLDEVMHALAAYYEREANIASAIRHAVTYPMIMVVMMLFIILLLLTRVLPVFHQVFHQFGTGVTGISKTLMDIGTAMNRYSVVFIVLFLLLAAAFLFFSRTAKGRELFLKAASKLRLSHGISDKTAACRFAGGMALTLRSGLTTEESLAMAGSLSENPVFQEKLDKCRSLTESGEDLSSALAESEIFSGLYARMVTVGYKTGSLDEVMQKIADRYEEEIDEKISHTIGILEPTLVAVLSVVTGLILLSVMLPLMGILSGF